MKCICKTGIEGNGGEEYFPLIEQAKIALTNWMDDKKITEKYEFKVEIIDGNTIVSAWSY